MPEPSVRLQTEIDSVRNAHSKRQTVRFFVQSNKSDFAVTACLELFSHANKILGEPRYGTEVSHDLFDLAKGTCTSDRTTIILFGHIDARWTPSTDEARILRSKLPCTARIGIVGGAAFALKTTPILRTHTICVHRGMRNAAREEGIQALNSESSVSRDRQIFSAIGGIAALHMVVDMIAEDCGGFLAERVVEHIGLERAGTSQFSLAQSDYVRLSQGSAKLMRALAVMNENVETPLSSKQLASQLGVSSRSLERTFQSAFGQTPMEVYREVKLDRARQLLRFSNLPILEVSIASGFGSASLMTQRYRQKYGHTPTQERARRYGVI